MAFGCFGRRNNVYCKLGRIRETAFKIILEFHFSSGNNNLGKRKF